MGSVVVVGSASANARNAPPVSYLQHLASLIAGLHLSQDVIVNGAGESLVPGSRAWTPDEVAAWVNGGGVWIDWCGWPMYSQGSVNGGLSTLGATGFQQFAAKAGYAWLDQETFLVPAGFGSLGTSTSYPFARAYTASGSQAGVSLPSGTIEEAGGIAGIGGAALPISADGHFAMMGLHAPRAQAPSAGTYIYAEFSPALMNLLANFPAGRFVPAASVTTFLAAVVHGDSKANGMVISRAPYSVSVPKSPSGGGSGTPYTQSPNGPGFTYANGYYTLTQKISAQTLAAQADVSLSALLAANSLDTWMAANPKQELKIGSRLKAPSTSTKKSGGGGTSPPSTPSTPTPYAKYVEYAGIGVGGLAAVAATVYGVRTFGNRKAAQP